MIKYNLVIIESKQCIPFLNLTEQEFYDKLWEWTYENDLWDYIEENNPTDEELENFLDSFIRENVFHEYEDDNVDCFAFIVDDSVKEYQIDEELFEFIYSKIKKHYEKKTYEVTLHRVVEHETIYRVKASNEEEAEELVICGNYDEITHDCEEGETEDPEVINVVIL